jgi:hypothetical protein
MKHRVKLIMKTEKRGIRGLQGIYLRPQRFLVSSSNNQYRMLKQMQRIADYTNEDLAA